MAKVNAEHKLAISGETMFVTVDILNEAVIFLYAKKKNKK